MKTITAILADDEQNLTDYLKQRLATLWPELDVVATAANGAEALQQIDDHAPDVVFLDIRMPGLTGLEVAGRIDPKTHVVFVTAYDQYAVDAFDKQAVDYLTKKKHRKTSRRFCSRSQRCCQPQEKARTCAGFARLSGISPSKFQSTTCCTCKRKTST
jgi:DNA-binding LytR/AlgR family response regulator